jgi:hypothetical protein
LLRDPPAIFEVEGSGRRLVALLNGEAAPRDVPLAPELSAPGCHRYELWRDTPLPAGATTIRIARHGAAAVLQTPRRAEPAVIGTSLHLMSLVDGRVEDRFDPDSAELVVRGRDLARTRGSLWLAVPPGLSLDRGAMPREVAPATRWAEGLRLVVRAAPPWEIRLRFRRDG